MISDTESQYKDGFDGEEHARKMTVVELPPKMAATESNQQNGKLNGYEQRMKAMIELTKYEDTNCNALYTTNKEDWKEASRVELLKL